MRYKVLSGEKVSISIVAVTPIDMIDLSDPLIQREANGGNFEKLFLSSVLEHIFWMDVI